LPTLMARHHHLRLTCGHAPADLAQDRSGRARSSPAADGGDDAVGTTAVASVLDLDEAPSASGDLGRRRALAREQVVLEVGAGQPRFPAADRRGDIFGRAHERRHARIDLVELAPVEIDRAA